LENVGDRGEAGGAPLFRGVEIRRRLFFGDARGGELGLGVEVGDVRLDRSQDGALHRGAVSPDRT